MTPSLLKKLAPLFLPLAAFVLVLIALLGVAISVSLIKGINLQLGVPLSSVLFLLVGAYLIYVPTRQLFKLHATRATFSKNSMTYMVSHSRLLLISLLATVVVYAVFPFRFPMPFIVQVILFAPQFLLPNILFMGEVFLSSIGLGVIDNLFGLLLPLAQFYYVYVIADMILRITKHKNKKPLTTKKRGL